MAEALLAANASPILVANDGTTAYSAAMSAGRPLVALMIAEAGAIRGVESDNLSVVMEHLRHGAYVNIRNSAGWTPLMLAVASGDLEATREIMTTLGADGNRTENDGWTALHFAANAGHAEIVKLLLESNCDPTILTVDGRSAKDLAKAAGFEAVVTLLPDGPSDK
jgi:ankyrin repeat protein